MTDIDYMRLAIELAKNGLGFVSPNPMVGCVIVKNEIIIGKGWHTAFGKPHAEIEAMRNIEPESLEGATLYVNLEPCSHYGKTPPCTDAIIQSKIKRVVVGMVDPNPLVRGNGIDKLQSAGIEVISGVLEEESRHLNRCFIKFISQGLPYVVLKTAVSLDGFTTAEDGTSKWLTSNESRHIVHKLRSELDAVIVGKNTILMDNPKLDARFVNGRAPVRVILDSNLEISESANVYKTAGNQKTIVAYSKNSDNFKKSQLLESIGVNLLPIGDNSIKRLDLDEILVKLANEHNIASVLVEGGAEVHSSFLTGGYYDELHLFIAPIILGAGKKAFGAYNAGTLSAGLKFAHKSTKKINNDCYIIYKKDENG